MTESLITKAIYWLSNPSFDATCLSDHEVAVLIGATGRSCQMMTPKRRYAKTVELLKILDNKGNSGNQSHFVQALTRLKEHFPGESAWDCVYRHCVH